MITIWRIFVASWKQFFRNAWLGMATVFVFWMALLSVNVLLGVNAMLDRAIVLLENKVDVTVTFKPGTSEPVLNQARFYLTSLDQVSDVRYVSASDALSDFRARHAKEPTILAGLTELNANPLGAQLVVKAKRSDQYPFLLQAIQNPQYAGYIETQTYDDHEQSISKIRDVSRNIRLVGAALVAVFALFGLLTIFNMVRVAIYTQRDEIAIMRLVGASSAYIRAPIILEGIWLALIALVSCAAVILAALVWVEPALSPIFDGQDTGLRTFFVQQAPQIILIEAGGLLLLVSAVSWLAAGKYMRR